MHHLSLVWETILSSKASGLSRLHTREQGPYLDDWGCSSEEIEAKVKELGLESVAQVVSLDACRNTERPKLNDTGMILRREHHGVSFSWVGCRSGSQGVRAYRVQ